MVSIFWYNGWNVTTEQDGFNSDMREIEKSVYIAADAELLKCDVENSRDIGRTWGGASAGDFTGAAQVRACPTRLNVSSRSSSLSGMRQGENGPIVPGRTPVQG